jgi:hypothetical protein
MEIPNNVAYQQTTLNVPTAVGVPLTEKHYFK